MSTKFRKPWFRKTRNAWYVTLDGRQINLGPDKDAAFARYHQLKGRPAELEIIGTSIAEILDAFLDWCKLNRAERTYEWYLRFCQQFLDFIPKGLKIEELKNHHMQRWLDSHTTWAPGNKHNACRAIQTALNWAVRLDYIEKSPIKYFDKPPAGKRDRVVTDEEFKALLESTKDQAFRDILQIVRETGARAEEIVRLEHRHVDTLKKCWVFPPKEAKGRKRQRVVYLSEAAFEITSRWLRRNSTGKLFRNTRGKPWTTDAINCRFCTLKRKLKTKFCITNLRHTFGTKALQNGLPDSTVAALMGHTSTETLTRVYAHVGHDPVYMRQAANRATTAPTA